MSDTWYDGAMQYKPDENQKVVGVREITRNFSYYLDSLDEPVVITHHGEVAGVIISPDQYFASKLRKKQVKKKRHKLLELAFFKDFEMPSEQIGKSSTQIAKELREKAWYGK